MELMIRVTITTSIQEKDDKNTGVYSTFTEFTRNPIHPHTSNHSQSPMLCFCFSSIIVSEMEVSCHGGFVIRRHTHLVCVVTRRTEHTVVIHGIRGCCCRREINNKGDVADWENLLGFYGILGNAEVVLHACTCLLNAYNHPCRRAFRDAADRRFAIAGPCTRRREPNVAKDNLPEYRRSASISGKSSLAAFYSLHLNASHWSREPNCLIFLAWECIIYIYTLISKSNSKRDIVGDCKWQPRAREVKPPPKHMHARDFPYFKQKGFTQFGMGPSAGRGWAFGVLRTFCHWWRMRVCIGGQSLLWVSLKWPGGGRTRKMVLVVIERQTVMGKGGACPLMLPFLPAFFLCFCDFLLPLPSQWVEGHAVIMIPFLSIIFSLLLPRCHYSSLCLTYEVN